MSTYRERIGKALKRRWAILGTLATAAVAVAVAVTFFGDKADASNYRTAVAEHGSIEVTVSATGTVQAVTTVQVGSQASGTVSWLGADFNSEVKRGQVIAQLDPTTFEAQVENARASVTNAEAAVRAAESEISNQAASIQAAKANEEITRIQRDDAAALVERYATLSEVIPARDIESARSAAGVAAGRLVQASAQVAQVEAGARTSRARLDQARAQLAQARAQLEQASANLGHTAITSPIDGIVVSRAIDVGQTVAASLQAPTLFTIANDLTKMRVLASVDEADVGQVREGQKAAFTVDAFPGEEFAGTVAQIRLDAQAAQNVVTYTAVVEVSNPELRLRPGMTANITFSVASRENVLTVPNAALRFKPSFSESEQAELRARMQAGRQERASERDAGDGAARGDRAQGSQARAGGQTVWVVAEGGKLEPRRVVTGLTDGRVTEVVSGSLREGEVVVTSQNDPAVAAPQAGRSPLAPSSGRGFSGGRRGR